MALRNCSGIELPLKGPSRVAPWRVPPREQATHNLDGPFVQRGIRSIKHRLYSLPIGPLLANSRQAYTHEFVYCRWTEAVNSQPCLTATIDCPRDTVGGAPQFVPLGP